MPTLTRMFAGSHLYQPADASTDRGYWLFFLPSANGDGPQGMSVRETWDNDNGYRGYHLFLSTLPSSSELPAFDEALLKSQLGTQPLDHTSLAWLQVAHSAFTVHTSLLITLSDRQPVLKQGVVVATPSPLLPIPLQAGAPVLNITDDADIVGFTLTYPPQPGSQPPRDVGLNIPLHGLGRGAIQFQALVNSPYSQQPASTVVKDLYQVSIDPLAPFNPERTYLAWCNQSYRLSKTDNGFAIEPING